MIKDYVSNTKVESIYNIDKTLIKPKIVIHQDKIEKIANKLVDDIIKNVVSENTHKEVDNTEKTKKNNSIEIKKEKTKEIEKEIEKETSTDPNKVDADESITNVSSWCTIM